MSSAPMSSPTWFEWITVAAIVLGPVLALFSQRVLDRLREKKERRVQLFLTLMRTRATPLAPDHVNALNSIDVVFDSDPDQKIREAWRKLLNHIMADTNHPTWQERFNDLKVELLKEIGLRVGYSFDIDYLKRQVYYPKAFSDIEADALQLRTTLTKALTEDGLKVQLVAPDKPKGD
jgi:hypothetical protein